MMGLCNDHRHGQNAMPTSNRFGAMFATAIVATLGCFDRVIFRGYLPLGYGDSWLDYFVGHTLGMRCVDFTALMESYSRQIVEAAQKLVAANRGRWTQTTTGSLHKGETTYVYGRRAQPCRRCGTAIRKAEQDERVTYWCPRCQPEP